MKKALLTITGILILALSMTAQSAPFKIEEKKVPGGIEFYCHSSHSKACEITFTLDQIRNVKGYSKPVVKAIPANGSVLLLKISTADGFKYRYSTQFKEKRSMSNAKPVSSNTGKTVPYTPEVLKKGIVLFDKTGCGRCTYAGNYMITNNIPFTVLNISEYENNELMWQALRDQGFKGKRFQTPAIMVDGEISHSHKNLETFLAKLKR